MKTAVADLATKLQGYDPRICADVVDPWGYGGCDLCGVLECVGNVTVYWVSRCRGDAQAEVNVSHLDGWVTGWLLPDCAPEHGILIQIGDVRESA